MYFMMMLLLVGLVLGLVAVASNPSPFFAALGLVMVAGMGCGVLVGHGGPFLSLVLFLIYLGGMLVVFAYSAALAAEPFPESWGSRPVVVYMLFYILGVGMTSGFFWGEWHESLWLHLAEMSEFAVNGSDVGGVALMYSDGGIMLFISAWALFLALLVVLELTRGLSRGSLRAI